MCVVEADEDAETDTDAEEELLQEGHDVSDGLAVRDAQDVPVVYSVIVAELDTDAEDETDTLVVVVCCGELELLLLVEPVADTDGTADSERVVAGVSVGLAEADVETDTELVRERLCVVEALPELEWLSVGCDVDDVDTDGELETDTDTVPVRVALNDRVVIAETDPERLLLVLRLVVGDTEEDRLFDGDPDVVRVVVIERVDDEVILGLLETEADELFETDALADSLDEAELLVEGFELCDVDEELLEENDDVLDGCALAVFVAVKVCV